MSQILWMSQTRLRQTRLPDSPLRSCPSQILPRSMPSFSANSAAILPIVAARRHCKSAADGTRHAPPDAVAAKAMFLSIYDDGQAYTESEYRGWLRAAGLVDIQRRELAGGYSIIHGRKA